MSESLPDAVAAWHADHANDGAAWPPVGHPGRCPACKHDGCFATGPGDPNPPRWYCFSKYHQADSGGVGQAGNNGWWGDALDLEAYGRGLSRAGVLRADGYLTDRPLTREEKATAARAADDRRRAAREAAELRERALRGTRAQLLARMNGPRPWVARMDLDWETTVTRFSPKLWTVPTAQNPRGERVSLTWPDLRRLCAECPPMPTVPEDLDVPERAREAKAWIGGWSPSTFQGDRRAKARCEGARLLVLDLDGKRESGVRAGAEAAELQPGLLDAVLSDALPGVGWLCHTTASSTGAAGPRGWCWRVIIPLSRAVSPDEYRRLADAVACCALMNPHEGLALEADPGWREPERFYYLPAKNADYQWIEGTHRAAALDPDVLLSGPLGADDLADLRAFLKAEALATPPRPDLKAEWLAFLEAEARAEAEATHPPDEDPMPPPTADADPPPPTAEKAKKGTLKLTSVTRDWVENHPPERRYLLGWDTGGGVVDGLFPRGRVGLLAAAGGVGKSFALIDLAVAVAIGGDWLGMLPVDPENGRGRVLLAMGEEDADEIRRRLWEVMKARELTAADREAIMARVKVLPLAGVPCALTKAEEKDGNDWATEWGDDLALALTEDAEGDPDGWALVILDPVSRFAGGDAEKDNSAATRFIQALEKLTQLPGGPSVLAAVHTNKGSRAPGYEGATTAEGVRGSSAFTDGARWVAAMSPAAREDGTSDPDRVWMGNPKNNYCKRPGTPWLIERLAGGALVGVSTAARDQALEAEQRASKQGERSGMTDEQRDEKSRQGGINALSRRIDAIRKAIKELPDDAAKRDARAELAALLAEKRALEAE